MMIPYGVVILNYKSHDLTCNLVSKILSWESVKCVVVVDNASEDAFEDYLIKVADPRFHFLRTRTNLGYAGGNNIGLKYLKEVGCAIGFVANPDVDFSEKTLTDISFFLASHPDYAVASCKRTVGDNGETGQYWDIPSFKDSLFESLFLGRKRLDKKYRANFYTTWANDKDDFLTVEVVGGAFFGCSLKIMETIGYLDERTFLWYEENILGFKVKKQGFKEALLLTSSYKHNHFKKKKGNKNFNIYLKSKKVFCLYHLRINWLQKCLLAVFDFLGLVESKIIYIIGKMFK